MRAGLSWDGKGKRIAVLALVLATLAPTAASATTSSVSSQTAVVYQMLSARGSSWS